MDELAQGPRQHGGTGRGARHNRRRPPAKLRQLPQADHARAAKNCPNGEISRFFRSLLVDRV